MSQKAKLQVSGVGALIVLLLVAFFGGRATSTKASPPVMPKADETPPPAKEKPPYKPETKDPRLPTKKELPPGAMLKEYPSPTKFRTREVRLEGYFKRGSKEVKVFTLVVAREDIELNNRSQQIHLIWFGTDEAFKKLALVPGKYRVSGKDSEYNGKPQLIVSRFERIGN